MEDIPQVRPHCEIYPCLEKCEEIVLAKYRAVGAGFFSWVHKHNAATDGTRLSFKDLQSYLWVSLD